MSAHPTARVAAEAELGPGVEIGPFAQVGPRAVVGAGCRILARAVLTGPVTMGDRNVVGCGAVIGAAPPEAGSDGGEGGVRIGHGNTFREYVTIHRGAAAGSATLVGDGNFLMVGTHLGPDSRVGDRAVVANNCRLAAGVRVGDRAVLGGGSGFAPGVRIGRLAMVSGGANFSRDIAPFSIANADSLLSGVNVIGLRRAGAASGVRIELKRLFRVLFRTDGDLPAALAAAAGEAWGVEAREMLDFVREACARQPCRARYRVERGVEQPRAAS